MPGFVNYKKGCIRLAAASDKVYQLLAHGWWFSPGTPASSTTKTGRHDIAESGVKHNKSNQITYIIQITVSWYLIHVERMDMKENFLENDWSDACVCAFQ